MKPTLKYLFEAEYEDKEVYKQTPDDKSLIAEKKSQFYDVLNSGKTIRRFSLVGEGNRITVDLRTGVFYINKLAVLLESEKLPGMPVKFELIFYRQWTQNVDIDYKVMKIGPIKITKESPREAYCEYFIGWKCEIAGKSYQQKIAVL